jgi:hypothetical protein
LQTSPTSNVRSPVQGRVEESCQDVAGGGLCRVHAGKRDQLLEDCSVQVRANFFCLVRARCSTTFVSDSAVQFTTYEQLKKVS